MPLKSNRKVALSAEDKRRGVYERVAGLQLEPNSTREVYLEQVEFPLLLVKQIFKNEDGTVGIVYLVSSDVTLDYERLTTIYQRRWKVEEYHKSLKSNASLAKTLSENRQVEQYVGTGQLNQGQLVLRLLGPPSAQAATLG